MFKHIKEGISLFKKNPADKEDKARKLLKEDKARKLLIEAKYYLALGDFENYGDIYDLIVRIENFLSQKNEENKWKETMKKK